MRISLLPTTALSRQDILEPFTRILRNSFSEGSVLKTGFAYTTLGGVQHFVSSAESTPCWQGMEKRFLVGIDQGLTEPSALEILTQIPNAHVRVFIPGGRLLPAALFYRPLFHAKIIGLTSSDGADVHFLQAGSANMTSSAMGLQPRNHEFSIAIDVGRDDAVDFLEAFGPWWANLWRNSKSVDSGFIRKYAKLREGLLLRRPGPWLASEVPASIGRATYFFAEVGAGSGPPGQRHQIEFPESLSRYFGPVRRARRGLTLRRGGQSWTGRPLSYKRTTYGVEIWRLGMPTQATGGPAVAERAIRFKRTPVRNVFEFEVDDVDSAALRKWVRLANRHGHIGSTHSLRARQYGFY